MPNAKLALVVDDSVLECSLLSHLLSEEDYQIVTAIDGQQGVDMYIKHQPDLVLMNINMPVMNGYDAAKLIKKHSGQYSLCPLIFVADEQTDLAYVESTKAGGDGILFRPFSPEAFKAKIKSIERISDLYAEVKMLQQVQDADVEIAQKLMSDVIEARNYGLDRIGIIKKPAALFSGDIQLSALCPNGDINVLLGDFTGHGLRSTIGAVPLAETFRAMTRKGFSIIDIVTQINIQMYNLLPADLFLAATFVSISSHEESAYILNAGLPDAYIFSIQGDIKHKISSSHPPMGVVKELLPNTQVSIISVLDSDRVVLLSDGIVEARNEYGQMYEYQRFENAVRAGTKSGSISESVLNSVNDFCHGMAQEDDISLVDIPCKGWKQALSFINNFNEREGIDAENEDKPAWEWRLSLSGPKLATVNPIPMAMSQVNEIEGNGEHWLSLHTILTELFINSLDHGVLGLSSELKSQPEGFAEYFKERELRLKRLDTGFVNIELNYYPLENGGRLKIKLIDSGQGFDLKKYYDKKKQMVNVDLLLSGRGIELVEQLSEYLDYYDEGRVVEASFLWAKE